MEITDFSYFSNVQSPENLNPIKSSNSIKLDALQDFDLDLEILDTIQDPTVLGKPTGLTGSNCFCKTSPCPTRIAGCK